MYPTHKRIKLCLTRDPLPMSGDWSEWVRVTNEQLHALLHCESEHDTWIKVHIYRAGT